MGEGGRRPASNETRERGKDSGAFGMRRNAPPNAPAPYKGPWGPRSTSICFKSSSWKVGRRWANCRYVSADRILLETCESLA